MVAASQVAIACAPSGSTPSPSTPSSLTIFAAASLQAPMAAVAAAYRAETGIVLVVTADATSTLRTQIEQGARADVLLAADTAIPAALAKEGLVDGAVVPFAGNGLAIVVPSANPAGIATPDDLARPGVKVIAAGDAVPITGYAAALVAALGARPGAPVDFAARYAANVASREDNVRAVLTKIELGEGDAAIVYATDAAGSSKVRVIALPSGVDVVATYAGIVPAGAPTPGAAHAFLAWLAGPEGQAILARFGFVAPRSGAP